MAPIPSKIGRYDIIELVGRGGMGVLYRARDAMLERDVALKMMLVDFSLDPSAHERFQREAKAVARLQHRNVVTIHELGESEGAPYIVMEFLSGRDLDALLTAETPLSVAQKIDVVIQLCEGLGYAHEQGIVHRDIKPGNVRLLEDGTVKILDFGIAKFAKSSVTQSGTILGTASYMAPEQIMGQQVDGRADLFSVGVLLHELLAGQKPFASDTPTAVVYQIMHTEPPAVRSLVPDLPDGLDEVVSRALAKNPDDRYSRATEMASDLQMIKMMLDLPLHGSDASPGGGLSGITSRLNATTIGVRPTTAAVSTAVRHAAIRSAEDAAAAEAQSESPVNRGKGVLYGGIAAAAVVVLGVVGYMVMGDRGGNPAPSDAAALVDSAGARPAGDPAAGNLLVLQSVPAGARIKLNGTDTGKTTPANMQLPKLPSDVELSLKGYVSQTGTVTDADVRLGNKEFRLARESSSIKLRTRGVYAFEVVVDGKVLSAADTEHEVTIPPGSNRVSARSQEYLLDFPLAIDFQKSQADVSLPGPGWLSVLSADESCKVVVDGQMLGDVPIVRKPIAAQSHTVTLQCPGHRDDVRKQAVPPGEHVQVKFTTVRG